MNTYWYGGDGDYVEYELVEKADKGNVNVDFRTPNGEYITTKSWCRLMVRNG